MRLIDADALIRSLSDWQFGESPTPNMNAEERHDAELMYEVLDKVIKGIDLQIAIEPERKKGKWSEAERLKSEVFYCSVCGRRAYHPWVGSRKDERKNVCRYNFCPNCGADMRGEEDDTASDKG